MVATSAACVAQREMASKMKSASISDGTLKSEQMSLQKGLITTLDEPVIETVLRDFRAVGEKLKIVLLPLGTGVEAAVLAKLKDWDLFGPLLVCLLLSMFLSVTAPGDSGSLVFAAVFVIVWAGAGAVAINAQLLGGNVSFFQSVCILGYCIFPLTISAFVSLIVRLIYNTIVLKLIIVGAGFLWSTRASVVFMGQVIKEERRILAVYPVFLFYTFIAWMILVQ